MCVYNHTHQPATAETEYSQAPQPATSNTKVIYTNPQQQQVFTEINKSNPQQPVKDMVQLTPVPALPVSVPVVQDIHCLQNAAPNLQPLEAQQMSIPVVQTTPKGDNSLQTVTAVPVLQSGGDLGNNSSMFVEHYLITKVIEKTPEGQQIKSESTLQLTPGIPTQPVMEGCQSVIDLSTTSGSINITPQNQPTGQFINTSPVINQTAQVKNNQNFVSLVRPGPAAVVSPTNTVQQVQIVSAQPSTFSEFNTNSSALQENSSKKLVIPADLNVRMEDIPAIIAANPDKKITILPTTDGRLQQPSIVKISSDKGYIELPCGMDGKPVTTPNFALSSANVINIT
jgi:hypothetical protein